MKSPLLAPLILLTVSLAEALCGEAVVYNLADDWSDTRNPNGPWSYNAGDTPISNHLDEIFTDFWTDQPGWGNASHGAGHTPTWFKMVIDSNNPDLPVGTVAVHGADTDPGNPDSFTTEPTNVTWTSPIGGTVDISGGAWMTEELGRQMNWTLTLNGAVLDTGALSDDDPYDASNPDAFAINRLPVAVGDVVKWETAQASEPYAHVVAIDLTIVATELTTARPVYDLAVDWSDAQNPNGPWSYNAGATPIQTHLDEIFTHVWSGQPGWAKAPQGAGHTPAWFKTTVLDETLDLPVGTVAVHGSDPDSGNPDSYTTEPANVIWTSPIAATIDVSGGAWMVRELGRSMHWALSLNGTVLDSGTLDDNDPYDSSNPDRFVARGLVVSVGDEVKWETTKAAEPYPHIVAVDFKITVTSGAMVYNLTDDWSDANNPNGPWSYNAGSPPIDNHLDEIFTHLWAGQPGWAVAPEGAGHTPAWFKMAIVDETVDLPVGVVAVHGSDTDPGNPDSFTTAPANVTWTSPFNGTIDISGGAWMVANINRSMNWTLSLNGTALASGTLDDNDPYHATNPNAFSASGLAIAEGDIVKWESTQAAEPFPHIVAVDLTIVASGSLPKPVRITGIARDPVTRAVTLTWVPSLQSGTLEHSTDLGRWETLDSSVTGTLWSGPIPGEPSVAFLRLRTLKP